MIKFTFAIFVSTFTVTDASGELKAKSTFIIKFFWVLAHGAARDCGCSWAAATFRDQQFCRCCCSVASTLLLLFESDCSGNHFAFEALCLLALKSALDSCSAHYFTLFGSFGTFETDVSIAHSQAFVSIGSFKLNHLISLPCFCIEVFYFGCSGSW